MVPWCSAVAKPRSPILGYNHNVRYRGIVFHVQTEDSGTSNPHVFTHLFHGGVILSTRKLVYDSDAAEESVKSLMQAQHKAVLRDLKKNLFDDKIDAYLGGTPGLLPRGQTEGGGPEPESPSAIMDAPLPPVAATPPPLADPDPTPKAQPVAAPQVPFPELPTMPIQSRTLTPPPPGSVTIPRPTGRTTGKIPPLSAEPIPTSAPADKRSVSAAFEAIMVAEDSPLEPGGGLVEVPDEDPAQIHAQAPPSAPTPPGAPVQPARATEYAQHRRRDSSPIPQNPDAVPQPLPLQPPSGPTPRASQPRVPTPQTTLRPPTTPPARPSQPQVPQPPQRAQTQAYGVPRSTPPPPPRPGQPRTRSPSGPGGVVVTRPAVIIGAPSRQVGGTGPNQALDAPTQRTGPPSSITAQQAAQKPPAGRVRKAREDSESGMFGQDLISEKSLDEVILAYLSEDGTEE